MPNISTKVSREFIYICIKKHTISLHSHLRIEATEASVVSLVTVGTGSLIMHPVDRSDFTQSLAELEVMFSRKQIGVFNYNNLKWTDSLEDDRAAEGTSKTLFLTNLLNTCMTI